MVLTMIMMMMIVMMNIYNDGDDDASQGNIVILPDAPIDAQIHGFLNNLAQYSTIKNLAQSGAQFSTSYIAQSDVRCKHKQQKKICRVCFTAIEIFAEKTFCQTLNFSL